MPKAKKSILIAEDDHFLLEVLKRVCEEHGAKTHGVRNGAEAITSIDKEQPDLLLLDLLMPDVDGYAVMKHIKEKKYDFPVVVLTNLGTALNADMCKKFGCSAYLVKSDMDEQDLWPKIEKHLK